jgi:hypothetical protein
MMQCMLLCIMRGPAMRIFPLLSWGDRLYLLVIDEGRRKYSDLCDQPNES